MKLRVHYLNQHDKATWYEFMVPDSDVRPTLDNLGRTVSSGALVVVDQDDAFSFAFPASRFLRIEKVKEQ